MAENENNLLATLGDSVDTDDFKLASIEIVEKLKKCENPFDFVEPILKFMEANPLSDFGVPGALVHFVESFSGKGYEELLYESVKRCPAMHTIWMVRRIINDETFLDKQKFIELLIEARLQNDLDEDIKSCIDEHLSEISTYY